MAISNRRNNTIGHLKIDGVLTSNQEVIEDGILLFYKNLYTKDKTHLPHLDVLNFSKITRDKAGWLEQLFDEGEIFGMLKDFNGNKAPGPDGFSMAFFQICWNIIKAYLLEVFQYFFNNA